MGLLKITGIQTTLDSETTLIVTNQSSITRSNHRYVSFQESLIKVNNRFRCENGFSEVRTIV